MSASGKATQWTVAEGLHAEDRDLLAWSYFCSDERTPYCETSTHHGSRISGGNVVGNLESKVFVSSNMTRITSLRYRPILVRRAIGIWNNSADHSRRENVVSTRTNHVRAIVFLICLAKFAFQARLDLSTYANSVANLDGGHLVADLDSSTDDLVTDTDGKGAVTPAASDGVDIGAADTTALNLDVNVTVFERLWLELKRNQKFEPRERTGVDACFVLLKICPFALVLDHVTFECFRITHLEV